MNLPGYRAEASIYRSINSYCVSWTSRHTDSSLGDPGRVIPMIGQCTPFCENLCESDINSPTGCSKTCTLADCSERQRSCTGCSNACSGGKFCRGKCTDLTKDRNNCGACGNVCPTGVSCLNGSCGCPTGQVRCANGCTNLNTSSGNCGACGNACAAGQICQNGSCVAANCPVFCSDWNRCNQTCGNWPPGLGNYQCWLDCLQADVDCLNATCGG
jgi:hypothetical protein